MQKVPASVEEQRARYEESKNYMLLSSQLVASPKGGVIRCPTPIEVAKLDELVNKLLDEGWTAEYHFTRDRSGHEMVELYYDI